MSDETKQKLPRRPGIPNDSRNNLISTTYASHKPFNSQRSDCLLSFLACKLKLCEFGVHANNFLLNLSILITCLL